MEKELELIKEKTRTLIICELRFNQNHAKDGRFTFGKGGSGGGLGSQVNDEAAKVQGRLTNEYKPFEKEAVNMKEVKARGGVSGKDAKRCVEAAENVYAEAASKEPVITDDVVSSVEEVGGKMYGLDFRLKQPTSLAGKIGADARENGTTFEIEAANIKDSVRYTAVLGENNFTQGYESIKASMESKGYTELRCKNFYQRFEAGKSDQKAIQCVYADKSGFKFEFQFHTAKSQGAKELNHPLYEEQRKATTGKARRTELSDTMKKIGSYVPNPVGVMNIKDYTKT